MSYLRNELLNIFKLYRSTLYSSKFDSILCFSKASITDNFIRTFSVENVQVRDFPEIDSHSVDNLFQRIEDDQRRFGYVTGRQIDLMHRAIDKNKFVTPGQSLFLLRCCGNLANMETSDWRKNTVLSILKTYNKLDFQLDISHYNMVLQVHLDNGFTFNPIEILQEIKEEGIEPNRVTYSKLIDYYCQNGDIDGSNKILELMKEKNLPLSEDIFNSLILGNAKTGDIQGALSILDTMKQCQLTPGPKTYAVLMQAYAETGDMDGMFKSMEDNEEFLYSGKAHLDVIPILSRKGLSEYIPKVLSKLGDKDIWIQYANGIIVKITNSGDFDSAFQLISALKNHNGRRYANFINSICYSDSPIELIIKYCKEMRNNGINLFSYEIALKRLLVRGQYVKVVEIIKNMTEEKLPLRSVYLYPLFSPEHGPKDKNDILQMTKSLQELDVPMDVFLFSNFIFPSLSMSSIDEICQVYLNLIGGNENDSYILYNGMVEHLLKEKKYEMAAGFVNRIKRSLNRSQYRETLMIEMMIYCKDLSHSVSVLRQFLPLHIRITGKEDYKNERSDELWQEIGHIFCRFVETLKRDGLIEEMLLPYLQTMKSLSVGIGPNKERIIECLGHSVNDDILESLEYLSNYELRPVDLGTFGASDTQYLEKKLSQEEEQSGNIIGLQIKLLNNYARANNVEKAEELKQKIVDSGESLGPLSQQLLADMYLRNERLEDAEKMFNQYLEENTNFIFSPLIIVKFANALVLADRIDDAIKSILLYSPAQGEWEDVEERLKDNVYRINLDRLMQNMLRQGDFVSLQRMQESLLSRKFGEEKAILPYTVDYHIMKEDYEDALKEFERISEEHGFTPAKSRLVCALIEKNNIDQLQRIVNVSAKLYGEMVTLYDLVFCFIDCGKLEQAEKILKTPGLRTLHDKLNRFCIHCLHKGKLTELEGLIAVTKNLLHVDRQLMYMHLLDGYIYAGNSEKAIDVWTSMQEDGVNSTDEFLMKLYHFLKSKDIEPPFKISEDLRRQYNSEGRMRPVQYQSIQAQQKSVETFEREVQLSPLYLTAKQVEAIMDTDQSEVYLSKIKYALVNGDKIYKRTLRAVVDALAKKGDVEALFSMRKELNESGLGPATMFNFKLGSAYKQANRTEEYLNWLHDQALTKDETTINNEQLISSGIIMKIMDEHKAMIPIVEKCAEAYSSRGQPLIYNIMFDYYITNGAREKGEQIYSDKLANAKTITVRNSLFTFWEDPDLSRVDGLLELFKNHPRRDAAKDDVISYIQSFRIKYFNHKGMIKEAIASLEDALKTTSIENLSTIHLHDLKKKAFEKNIPFPYTIPEKSETNSSSSDSESN